MQEKRRFPRIMVEHPGGVLSPLIGVEVQWAGRGPMKPVFDISYGGFAAAQDGEDLPHGKVCEFLMNFSGLERVSGSGEVVWAKEKVVGLSFAPLTLAFRQALDHYLKDKIRGGQLRRIDRKFFSPDLDCTTWYHGAFGTNIYVWEEGSRIIKMRLDIGETTLNIEDGEIWGPIDSKDSAEAKRIQLRMVYDLLSQLAAKDQKVRSLLIELAKSLGGK